MALPKSFKDMSGLKFTRLTVISRAESDKNGNARWHCQCDCGTRTITSGFTLRNGEAKSCGCLTTEQMVERNTKHSKAGTSEYMIWAHMIQRCTNQKHEHYHNYGGRGIRVCDKWAASFEAFFADVGPRPSSRHSIDRINNDGDYEPGNVRWATRREQATNRRNNLIVEYKGRSMTMIEAIEAAPFPVSIGGVRGRLQRGWTLDEALDTPPNDHVWRNRPRAAK